MASPIKNVLEFYRNADLSHCQALVATFLASTFLLSFLELVGLASIGALLVQLFGDRETIDVYIVEFESRPLRHSSYWQSGPFEQSRLFCLTDSTTPSSSV